MSILNQAIDHYRSTFSVLALILGVGLVSYFNMPIETAPEVKVPYVYVGVTLDGASPEDVARLLVRPIEQELRSLEDLDEMSATASESHAAMLVKFDISADADKVDQYVRDVRVALDRAKAELPDAADEPIVEEISAAGFPVVTVALSADGVPERSVFKAAQLLQREIEGLSDVLKADMAGHREEVVEALIDPARLEHYSITSDELVRAITGNNLLVPAGELETGEGRFSVKVPGLIESYQDVYSIPVKSTTEGVVTLGDVTDIRRTFKDRASFTSFNQKPAIMISVSKRSGANNITVAAEVREVVAALSDRIPPGITINYLFDQSYYAQGIVSEMRGNIVTAMALVMVVVIAALGIRSGLLVGFGIPFSLLMSLIGLSYIGYTFNQMVMFGMMLALGMLIDGAIVVTEYADRKMAEGLGSREAYRTSVKRMMWPVVASTATTLAAFLPIMFWPGVSGNFMRYLPVTVFYVLAASLLYALFFAPIVGSLLGKSTMQPSVRDYLRALETSPPGGLQGVTGRYARLLGRLLKRPLLCFAATIAALITIFVLYANFNAGIIFFADSQQKYGTADIRAQGNLSIAESRTIALEVEQRVLSVPGVKSIYASSDGGTGAEFIGGPNSKAKDRIGQLFIELENPEDLPRPTHMIFEDIRQATADMPGIIVTAKALEGGPPVGKPIQIQLESIDRDKLLAATRYLRSQVEARFDGLRDITDSTPLPGIEWEMKVDRSLAAQMGVNVVEVGRAVQLVTNGVRIGDYRPDDADDEVEIRVRYPSEQRGINVLDELRVNTPQGTVPIGSFVKRVAQPKVDKVQRIDSRNVMQIQADVDVGYLADDLVKEMQAWLADNPLDPAVKVVFRGANEEQSESAAFLGKAFLLALFLMFVLLVTQFNSFYHGALILSSVIMSTAGVLLGLLVTQATFSTILTGVGIVALAGIVVNNNIVLIDTFNVVRKENPDVSVVEAVVRACAQRLRPVFLTTVTTILGLTPMAMGVSIDLIGQSITVDGEITASFSALASAIVYGLLFSTILTLLVTPVMLVLPERLKGICQRVWAARPGAAVAE